VEYKTIDGVTYYKLASEQRQSPIVSLIALVMAFGLVAGFLAGRFGYAALG